MPAVLSGNTVVCKPSPFTPLSTLHLVELMNEVLPKGVVNCVTGKDRLGAAMAAHEGIGKIVFTGSCATGQKIMARAADTMKRLTFGFGGKEYFYPLTIVADLDNGDRLVDEEQFGPVLPIIRYRRIEDAIDRANDNPNGLGGSVWSRNVQKAKRIADKLECGSVWINKHGMIQPNAPFGGVKHSGFGVEFGEEGLVEYTDIQVVFS